jgi:Outer membrane protein beta-barrel domain/LysM domain
MLRTALILFLGIIAINCYSQTAKPEITILRQQGGGLFFWYTTKKADTKDYLIKRYYVSADSMAKYNAGLKWEGLKEKTLIKIPVGATNFSTTKKGSASDTMIALYHTVVAKETLWQIGQMNRKVPVENIKIWNNLKDDKISPGSDLIVGYLRRKKAVSGSSPTTAVKVETEKITPKKIANQKISIDSPVVHSKTDTAIDMATADTLAKKQTVDLSLVPPADSLMIKRTADSASKTVVDLPYIRKAPLARNRVNFIMKLSYLNSAFAGADASNNSFLLKNGSFFTLRNPGGKKRINAFSGGLGIENKIGMRLSLQTEILYERKGGDIAVDSAQTIPEKLNGDMRVRLNYLSFAFLPKLNFGKTTVFYIYAGVYGGFLMRSVIEGEAALKTISGVSSISVNEVNSRRFNKADLGYASGLGLKFPYKKTKRQHFILEGRYSQSFSTISNEEIGGKIPAILNRAFYFTVAYEFNR